MLAKIVSNKREYYSHIFAKFNPGWYEYVIVFDNENKKFEMLNTYNTMPSLKRKVFIIDTDTADMIEQEEIKISMITTYKNCLGYAWILNNYDLIKQIKAGKPVDEKYIKIAEELNNKIDTGEWKYVKNQKDVNDLMSAAFAFHDATIKSIHYQQKDSYNAPSIIQVLFSDCWECDIILEFRKDVLVHFNFNDNDIPDIIDSNILFHDGFIYWVDNYIDSIENISKDSIYFRGRSLSWKMITKEAEK